MECHHDGCSEQVIQKAYQVHLTECKYRTVVCKHCGDKHVHKDTMVIYCVNSIFA